MGSVYSIYSQMKFKDKNKAIKILQAKISRGKEEHTDYGLDTYRKSENLDINDIDDLIAVFILMQPVQNLNAITISAQLDYVEVVILVGSFLSMKKLKQFSQKMNMKKLFHSIYLSKHLIMESRRVITDIKQVLNLLILSNISMIN